MVTAPTLDDLNRQAAALNRLVADLDAKVEALYLPSERATLRAIDADPHWKKLCDDLQAVKRFDPAKLLAPDMLTCTMWGGKRRDPESSHKLYKRHRHTVLKNMQAHQQDDAAGHSACQRRTTLP